MMKRILIAEDTDSNYLLLSIVLRKEYETIRALNGLEAIEMCRTHNPDLILMDFKMPVMDGYESAAAIRAGTHPRAKTIPIVALTANAFEEDIQHALDAGMNEHIAKPVRVEKIKAAVSRLVKRG